jgi:hypothetical protein
MKLRFAAVAVGMATAFGIFLRSCVIARRVLPEYIIENANQGAKYQLGWCSMLCVVSRDSRKCLWSVHFCRPYDDDLKSDRFQL